jgi:hypothetical protein
MADVGSKPALAVISWIDTSPLDAAHYRVRPLLLCSVDALSEVPQAVETNGSMASRALCFAYKADQCMDLMFPGEDIRALIESEVVRNSGDEFIQLFYGKVEAGP